MDLVYGSISGIDLANRLRKQYKNIYLVFVTECYELISAVINQNLMPSGFLSKKTNQEEIQKVLLNIYNYCSADDKVAGATITISTGSAVYRIRYDDILYLESLNKKINVYTQNKRISCYSSLQTLGEELGEDFIRCHKSYIINKSKIKELYTRDMYVELSNGSKIPISRTYKTDIVNLYKRS